MGQPGHLLRFGTVRAGGRSSDSPVSLDGAAQSPGGKGMEDGCQSVRRHAQAGSTRGISRSRPQSAVGDDRRNQPVPAAERGRGRSAKSAGPGRRGRPGERALSAPLAGNLNTPADRQLIKYGPKGHARESGRGRDQANMLGRSRTRARIVGTRLTE